MRHGSNQVTLPAASTANPSEGSANDALLDALLEEFPIEQAESLQAGPTAPLQGSKKKRAKRLDLRASVSTCPCRSRGANLSL